MSDELEERKLDARLEQLRREREIRDEATRTAGRAMGIGFRIGIELVVGVAVGAAIGWALDDWLGTRPWIMIVGFLFGFAAGLRNVFRSVEKYDRKWTEADAADKAKAKDE